MFCNSVIPMDDIVKICVDFYKEEEVFTAKSLLQKTVHVFLNEKV